VSVLALLGGEPLLDEPIDESAWPVIDDGDIDAAVETLRSGRLSWMADTQVGLLEKEFGTFVGCPYTVALNSGTAALHAGLAAVGVSAGDEVIVPALSFLASATAVLHQHAIPVFADIDPVTFTLDPGELERRLSARTRAIVAVHLHGLPADMTSIVAFAERHGLAVIEDAAQAHGATYKGRRTGTVGDVAAFSIMAGKNLPTAGEGGLLTTHDPELRNHADSLKMFGRVLDPSGECHLNARTLGYNYRLSPILAAVARTQLEKLERHTAEVQAGAERLTAALGELPGIEPPFVPADRTHVYHHYRVRVDPAAAGVDLPVGEFRQAVQHALAAEGVPAMLYQSRPLPGQPIFQEQEGYGNGCPWTCGGAQPTAYRSDDHPKTLDVIRGSFVVGRRLCMASLRDPENVELIAAAFEKVLTNPAELTEYARRATYVEPWDAPARLW
jgi:perosamine synthetase